MSVIEYSYPDLDIVDSSVYIVVRSFGTEGRGAPHEARAPSKEVFSDIVFRGELCSMIYIIQWIAHHQAFDKACKKRLWFIKFFYCV